jgi:hypothetical protein
MKSMSTVLEGQYWERLANLPWLRSSVLPYRRAVFDAAPAGRIRCPW